MILNISETILWCVLDNFLSRTKNSNNSIVFSLYLSLGLSDILDNLSTNLTIIKNNHLHLIEE